MKRAVAVALLLSLLGLVAGGAGGAGAAGAAEIRDVAGVVGVRSNQLIGYGLVVGLKGTGDRRSTATFRAMTRMMQRLNLTLSQSELRSKNAALVIVTAELPAFMKEGSRIDVTVSSIGDAESLQGGRLIATPLHGPDPEVVYARVQGSVTFGGAEKPAHPTSGRIPRGGIVEREVEMSFAKGEGFELAIKRPSFALAQTVADAINNYMWRGGAKEGAGDIAVPVSPGLVKVTIPKWERAKPVAFISQLLRYPVDVDLGAMVVINERTGTVAVNQSVRVGPAAVSHGALYVETPASAPAEPAGGAGGGGGGGGGRGGAGAHRAGPAGAGRAGRDAAGGGKPAQSHEGDAEGPDRGAREARPRRGPQRRADRGVT